MIEITIPRLGWSMEEGTFSEWLKREGDWVEKGDMLFVLESDKAAQEIESFESGVLRLPAGAPNAGQVVSVGQVIGYLVAREEAENFVPPETAPVQPAAAEPKPMAAAVATEEKAPQADVVAAGAGKAAASPRVRRAANERGIDWKLLLGSGRDGRVRERDVLAAAMPAAEKAFRAAFGDAANNCRADARQRPCHGPRHADHENRCRESGELAGTVQIGRQRNAAHHHGYGGQTGCQSADFPS